MKANAFLLIAVSLFLTSCASTGPTGGLIYHDIKYGIDATTNVEATKKGQACQTSILGMVGFGDASIETAKKENGITKVATIDANSTSVLWFYNKYCTVITGH
jgi:hypothetical protein